MAEAKTKKEQKEETKQSEYQKAMEKLQKDFGAGIVMGANDTPRYTEVVSTGSLKFDRATGIGGIPLTGCLIEFYGWESSGKSTFTLLAIANAQKARPDKRALLVDGEHSFDKMYAKALGVNLDRLDVTQPECGEDAYNIANILLKSEAYCIAVIDSQTSLKPRKVVDGELGISHLGLEARMMGDAVHKMLQASKVAQCPVIFISQLREKIGVMWGSPETTSGGNALKFYAHMRVDIRKTIKKEKEDGDDSSGVAVANKTSVKVVKNKFAPPFGEGRDIFLIFGEGIDTIQEILDLAVEAEVIKKSGSWYSYGEMKLGQGADTVKALLADNEELVTEIKNKTMQILNVLT